MNPPSLPLRLDRLFAEQVARTPDAVALIDADRKTTFAELSRSADRVAEGLGAHGIRDGAVIGIRVESPRDYIGCVLGVLKANAAAMPLPKSYPDGRLRDILSAAALDAILVDDDSQFESTPAIRLPAGSGFDVAHGPATAVRGDDADRPAFVLCSSGSTGTPKMIVRNHRSFFHRLQWTWNGHPYEAGEVCCWKAHRTTTHAIYELFEPLLRGIPVCIVPERDARSLESFWDLLRRHRVTRLLLVPSVLQASLDMPGFAPPDIRVLVLMGEYVHAGLAARTVAAFPATTKVYSIYGSTEASSTLVCDVRASLHGDKELPLGAPISPDIRAYVLDDGLDPVARGGDGMLYIAGPALFSGYFRDDALTAAAFATLGNGERAYRTNDRVRRMADGSLLYLGRVDHTVKVRGFRVDVQEVEKALARHPGVRQGAVIAQPGSGGSVTLMAFVTPADLPPSDVYRVLRDHLPDYMLPSRIIAMDSLPLTASGKIDRRRLLESCGTPSTAPAQGQAFDGIEGQVAAIWHSVLGHGDFGPDSNFFEAGGTSLQTFSVIVRLRDRFNLDRSQLPDNAVYRLPTIARIARYIGDLGTGHAASIDPSDSILVTLRAGRDADAPPLFVIASAGGTLGAYAKVIRALETRREVIGIRDPFLWGARDPTAGFRHWISLYLDAIRARQPEGPYSLLGYSSAGAFTYEIARQLRRAGQPVAMLALIDPLATDSSDKRRFGHWAFESRFMRREFMPAVRAAGWLHRHWPFRNGIEDDSSSSNDFAFTQPEYDALAATLRSDRRHIQQLSALLELNTDLPFAMMSAEIAAIPRDQLIDALRAKVNAAAPDVDAGMIERLVVQYQLQVRTQHRYRLRPFDGTLVLFDQDGPYFGLLSDLFRPYVDQLVVHRVPATPPTGRTLELAGNFSNALRAHYLSMRNDTFARTVARELERLL